MQFARAARRAVNLLLLTMLRSARVTDVVGWFWANGAPEKQRSDCVESTAGAELRMPRGNIFYLVEKNAVGRLVLAFTPEAPR